MRRTHLTHSVLSTLAFAYKLSAQSPVLFYSDLTGGPNTGGENGNGAYVTLYGNFFGGSQGSSTVTAGGAPMVNCKQWGASWLWYQKLTCQLPPQAVSGSLVVTVNGQPSNSLPFSVTPGNIYFVSTSGNDRNAGTFAAPFRTLLKARNTMQPGDVTYALDGVSQSADDGSGWDAAFLLSGGGQGNWCSASGPPRALVAYPGATVTIGNPSGNSPAYGLRTSDCQGNYILAGISFRGQAPAQPGSGANYRFVASDITCPYTTGDGGGSCFETSQASTIYFYGNHVYNAGAANASALFQGVYFSTDSNFIDMGWNLVEDVHGCRGVQVHSSPLYSGGPSDPTGHDQYSISIHDNTIHDTQCDGLIVDTIDPSKGAVAIYNNVIYNAGKGPNNPEGTGAWNCINIPGSTENGPYGSGTVEIFNNTLFACGTYNNPPWGNDNNGIAENGNEPKGGPAIYLHSRNNLIDSVTTGLYPKGVPYFVIWNETTGGVCTNSQNCPWLYGSNNLLWGAGPPATNLAQILNSVYGDPLLVSTSLPDLHLNAGSPASGAGAAITGLALFGANNVARDHDGLPRPALPTIGAYEIGGSGGGNPSVSVDPTQSSLAAGQSQQFNATVNGSPNTAVSWSMTPVNGTLSPTGLYTAPTSLDNPGAVTITATSVVDPNASASATVALTPNPITIAVTPSGANLGPAEVRQFTVQINGAKSSAVTWSMAPSIGTLSASGLYTAPSSLTITQSVTVTATSVADPTRTAAAKIVLVPAGQYSVTYNVSGGSVIVSWQTPAGKHTHDWIGISSPGAPSYWYTSSQSTGGASSGSVTLAMPPSPGLWEFRYYLGNSYAIAAASAPLAAGTAAFSVTASASTVAAGAPLTIYWTAPSGRPTGDAVDLFAAGRNNDAYPVAVQYVTGAAGSFTVNAPQKPGQYQLRYLLSGTGWIAAAIGPTITVQ